MNTNTTTATPTVDESVRQPWMDDFETEHSTYEELLKTVQEMEDNSRWTPGLQSKGIVVHPIEAPMFAQDIASSTGMDPEMCNWTAINGSKLYLTLPNGKTMLLDRCGLNSLLNRACLAGSALGRMTPVNLAECINLGLEVARGESLVLERYGKVAATHSDAGDGYCVMPISSLLAITVREVTKRCGKMKFLHGMNSHSYTTALWELPEVQEKLAQRYKEAILKSGLKCHYDVDRMMPTVRLNTSDTATTSATIRPMFRMGSSRTYIQMAEDIAVRHDKRASGAEGLSLFEERVSNELYTRLNSLVDAAEQMAATAIYNPLNVVVGICNKFRIPKKYGGEAYETVQQFMVNDPILSAHDIFIALNEAISKAENPTTAMLMGEKLCALADPKFRWDSIDVPGVVAWANSAKEVAA